MNYLWNARHRVAAPYSLYSWRLTDGAGTWVSIISAVAEVGANHAAAQAPELAVLQGLVAPWHVETCDAIGSPKRVLAR
ncbi:MAG: hypothetical protein EHM33_00330 [Chloroflexi bacterium]|nr:MAG: hypothetical protein EHM33_00330 [Chloroflexota bacterium]